MTTALAYAPAALTVVLGIVSLLMVAVGDTAGLILYVNDNAPRFGLDPAAVLAVAKWVGWGGTIGDSGLAYGPWQDHFTQYQGRGPYYGQGRNNATVQTWAWSPAGIDEALSEMAGANGTQGATGWNAIHAIVYGFERSSDMAGETANAWTSYNSFNNGSAVGTSPGDTSGTAGGDTGTGTPAAVTAAEQLVSGASAGSQSTPSLFGNQDLGKAVARLTSPGFWWAAGLMVLAGILIVLGLVIYFRKDIESTAGTVARGAMAAA